MLISFNREGLLPLSRLIVLSLGFLIAACNSGGGYGGAASPPPPPPPPPPTGTVIDSSGGTATSEDSDAAVDIPAGALAASTTITIDPAGTAPAGNIGTAYDYGPDGTTFSQPVTIRLVYDAASLPAGVFEADLRLAKAVGGAWEPLPDSGADPTAGEVSGPTSSFSVYGILPVTPSNLSAVPADGQVTVDWDPVPNALNYTLYWDTAKDVSKSDFRIPLVAPPYVHTGRTNGTPYYYKVAAVSGLGEGGLSLEEVSATPMATGSVPGLPVNLHGCADNQRVDLTWNAVADATSYNVYGSNSPPPAQLALVQSGVTPPAFAHLNLVNGDTWRYSVSGVNAVGEGSKSAISTVELTTLAPPQNVSAVAGTGQNTISWDAVDCADSYHIYWNNTGNVSTADNQLLVPDPATTQFNHTGLVAGTPYHYVMTTVNGLGEGAISSPEVSATPTQGALPVGVGAGRGDGLEASCAIMNDGTLKCWGGNPGDGGGYTTTPVTVPGITAATAVSIGDAHTCVIDGGQVKCWGAGNFGELGDGNATSSPTPVTAVGLTAATAVAAGDSVTCAIENGVAWCWGNSPAVGDIDLMNSTFARHDVPFQITGLPATVDTIAVARSNARTCARLGNLEVWCWGILPSYLGGDGGAAGNCNVFNWCLPTVSPVPGGTGVVTNVVLGHTHVCFLISNASNAVNCVGFAQGMDFGTLDSVLTFSILSAGEDFYCGLAAGGIGVCWGWNAAAQLGDGTTTIYPYTTAVPVTGVGNATDIAAGFAHGCAVDQGVVKCWGQIPGGPSPFIVPGL